LIELKQTPHLVPGAPLQDAQYAEVSDVAHTVLALAFDHCAKHLIEDERDSLLEVGGFLPHADYLLTMFVPRRVAVPTWSSRHVSGRSAGRPLLSDLDDPVVDARAVPGVDLDPRFLRCLVNRLNG